MKIFKEIEGVGTVCYEESVLTGQKSLSLDGVKMNKISKTMFECAKNKTVLKFFIDGNIFRGINLLFDGTTYELLQKVAWYEYIVAFIGCVFVLVWGNVPALCAIFPVVGGAIGGLLGALGASLGILLMKVSKKPGIRLLIGFAGSVISVLLCFLVGLAIVSAVK